MTSSEIEIRRDVTIARLADRLADMESEIATLRAGNRSSQLPFSTVEGGGTIYRDRQGNIRHVVGLQPDGTYTTIDYNAPPPGIPNTPILTPSFAGIQVEWTGTFTSSPRPADFSHLLVYVSPVSNFIPGPSNLVGTLTNKGKLPVAPLDYVPQYAKFIAVNTSGKQSEWSIEAGPVTPSRILGTDLFPHIITETEIADDSISTPKLQANAVTALNIIAEAIKGYHIEAGAITADKLEALLVLSSKIIAGDQTDWHLELGDPDTPILWWNNDETGFTLSRDSTTGQSNVFLSGRISFGNGSQLDSDYVDVMEQPATGVQQPKLRQSRAWVQTEPTTSTISPKWVSATQPGNTLLISILAVGASSFPTITAPAGWSQVATVTAGAQTRLSLYQLSNSPSHTGETFTANQASEWAIGMFEYQGLLTAASLDKTATNSGTGTTLTTGTTATTTQADELQLAVFAAPRAGKGNGPKTPTNSFSQVMLSEGAATGLSFMVASKTVSTTGTASAGASLTASGLLWTGLIATFKLASAAPIPPTPAAKTTRIYTQRRGGASTAHIIDENGKTYPIGRMPLCRVKYNASTTITANTNVYAQDNWVVDYDPDSLVAISTGPSVYSNITIPIDGFYLVDYRSIFDESTNTTDACAAFVTKNARDTSASVARDIKKFVGTGGDGSPVRAWDIVPLNAGDVLYWGNWASVNAVFLNQANTSPTRITVEFNRPL